MLRQCNMAGMTEKLENPTLSDKSANEITSAPDQPSIDFVLQAIVSLANETGIEMGITLCVGGIVVSGQLTSGKNYFKGIADEVLQASGPADQVETRKLISDYLGNFGKLIYEPDENEEQADKTEDNYGKRLPGFIHLREAKFFHNSGQAMPVNRGIWWRGRLCVVDAFSLGAMRAS